MKNIFTYLTLADKILICALVLLSVGSFPLVKQLTRSGEQVQIETDGRIYNTLSLRHDRTLSVPGPLGNTFVIIHDGEAHVSASPCLNKICIKTGSISRTGEIIACVPNKIVVRVIGGEDAPYDAVTQ